MTTYHPEAVVCGACGRAFTHEGLSSTNAFGSPDLDMRPPEMARSTLRSQVQCCPSCGFCAVHVNDFDERFREVMAGENYQQQLKASDYPELASAFICAGRLSESIGQHRQAGWAFLKAAWVLDDHRLDGLARRWRSCAADQFMGVLGNGEVLCEQAGASEAILVDCLRRGGRAAKALEVIRYAERGECDPIVRQILTYQRTLIENGDTACRRIEEALCTS